jgi:hypothetical protein
LTGEKRRPSIRSGLYILELDGKIHESKTDRKIELSQHDI